MAEWLKALVSKTGILPPEYRGFESRPFRKKESCEQQDSFLQKGSYPRRSATAPRGMRPPLCSGRWLHCFDFFKNLATVPPRRLQAPKGVEWNWLIYIA